MEIFNRHGIKATFAINSWHAENTANKIRLSELKSVYSGHEIAVHGIRHSSLICMPKGLDVKEIISDREALENVLGRIVRGMTYSYGHYSPDIIQMLPHCGIEYARTTNATYAFEPPVNPLEWHPTCHHKQAMELFDKFLKKASNRIQIFYFWGHSNEFDSNEECNSWEYAEKLCKKIGDIEEIWYATNIEVIDYITALKNLKTSIKGDLLQNTSAIPLWIADAKGNDIKIEPGETIKIAT